MSQQVQSSIFSRVLILIYGLISYVIGVAGLACIILALIDVISFGFLGYDVNINPVLFNFILVGLWGFIHTLMARDGFKQVLTKIIPEPAERSTYIFVAGITSALLVGLWQIVPGVIWAPSNSLVIALIWGVFASGWLYLLAASFAINHFDLFGLRQVYLNFKNQSRPPLAFTKRAMYKVTRHPIQTGVLIGVWALPEMTVTKIILSIGFTLYIFIGLWFEEKDLLEEFGESYEQYRQETGKLFPKIFK